MTGASISLEGRVAIVTGGSRGIGRGIAHALLRAGAEVAICARRPPPEPLAWHGRMAEFHACDIRKADEAHAFVDSVAQQRGRLDLLVNNAGGAPYTDAAAASARLHEAIIALNLLAPLHLSQAAHKWMAAQAEGGVIVNVGSVSGVRPSPRSAAYGMAKAGLINMTQSLAQEWGPKIRVNILILGLMETEAIASTYGPTASQAAIEASLPLRRMGNAQDVANAVLFLASPLAAYISGARINIDGGGERPLYLDILERRAESGGS